MLLARLVIALLTVSAIAGCDPSTPAANKAPPAVGVQPVAQLDYRAKRTFPARISALREAQIRPQVDGIIVKQRFQAGDYVKAGQPLYQLDDRLYRAQQQKNEAALAKAQAVRDTQHTLWQRTKQLVKEQAASQQSLDQAEQNYLEAEANLAQAKAELQLSRLNLDYSQLKSPIDGRVELSTVTEGSLVSAKQAEPLTTVLQLDPIYVDITVSGSDVAAQRQAWQQGNLTIELILENGERYRQPAELVFASSQIGLASAANTWRAKVANPDQQLLPGMFVQAQLQQKHSQAIAVVPQRALLRHPNGEAYVWRVDGQQVEQRTIELGEAVGDLWLVKSGIAAGELIAVDGLQHIRAKQPITPVLIEASHNDG